MAPETKASDGRSSSLSTTGNFTTEMQRREEDRFHHEKHEKHEMSDPSDMKRPRNTRNTPKEAVGSLRTVRVFA
jgi:hypothetical protein